MNVLIVFNSNHQKSNISESTINTIYSEYNHTITAMYNDNAYYFHNLEDVAYIDDNSYIFAKFYD